MVTLTYRVVAYARFKGPNLKVHLSARQAELQRWCVQQTNLGRAEIKGGVLARPRVYWKVHLQIRSFEAGVSHSEGIAVQKALGFQPQEPMFESRSWQVPLWVWVLTLHFRALVHPVSDLTRMHCKHHPRTRAHPRTHTHLQKITVSKSTTAKPDSAQITIITIRLWSSRLDGIAVSGVVTLQSKSISQQNDPQPSDDVFAELCYPF